MKELFDIQSRLNAPKNQRNNFGKYNYRSCEDILEALKPLLKQKECNLIVSDEVVLIGDRFYIKATATIKNQKGDVETSTAFARESENKKGMDSAQLTGATSSYARKYALNGLFAIDDSKDADHDSNNTNYNNSTPPPNNPPPELITPPQIKKINTLLTSLGLQKESVYKRYNVTSLKDLWKSTAIEAIKQLEQLLPKGE